MKPATITIKNSNYSPSHKNGAPYISVSFEGYQEGQGNPCDSEEEANEIVKKIQERYKDKYKIKIIDNREGQDRQNYTDTQDRENYIQQTKPIIAAEGLQALNDEEMAYPKASSLKIEQPADSRLPCTCPYRKNKMNAHCFMCSYCGGQI